MECWLLVYAFACYDERQTHNEVIVINLGRTIINLNSQHVGHALTPQCNLSAFHKEVLWQATCCGLKMNNFLDN